MWASATQICSIPAATAGEKEKAAARATRTFLASARSFGQLMLGFLSVESKNTLRKTLAALHEGIQEDATCGNTVTDTGIAVSRIRQVQ